MSFWFHIRFTLHLSLSFVKNTLLCIILSTLFSVVGNMVTKHHLSCLNNILHQNGVKVNLCFTVIIIACCMCVTVR